VAIKDRVAMLMTGFNADAAFWLEDNVWTTSTYYRNDLPGYLRVLNQPQCTERFRGQSWDLLLAKAKYHNSGPDKTPGKIRPKASPANSRTSCPDRTVAAAGVWRAGCAIAFRQRPERWRRRRDRLAASAAPGTTCQKDLL